jgi:hypothetical protein
MNKKRLILHFIVQVVLFMIICSTAVFNALILMGGIGGTALSVVPEFSFGVVGNLICPDGELEYYEIRRSYHTPGEREPNLVCTSEDGLEKDVILQGILAVLGATFILVFAITFIPIFFPLSITALVITQKFTRT